MDLLKAWVKNKSIKPLMFICTSALIMMHGILEKGLRSHVIYGMVGRSRKSKNFGGSHDQKNQIGRN